MSWRLARDSHAIERVAAAFQFAEPIPSRKWLQLLAQAEKSIPGHGFVIVSSGASRMPGSFPIGIRIVAKMGNGGSVSDPLFEHLDQGRQFQRLSGAELQEEIILNRDGFAYVTPLYSRWKPFRERLLDLIKPSLDVALEQVLLQLVKLEYWDRFVFDGPIGEVDYTELLKPSSRYVPGLTNGMKELWHSHVGLFAPIGDAQRRLIHLNLDVIDIGDVGTPPGGRAQEQRRSVGIYSMAQDTLDPANGVSDSESVLLKLDDMHEALKEVLREVITEQTAKRINLTPKVTAS